MLRKATEFGGRWGRAASSHHLAALKALELAPRAELFHVLMLPI
jgi:hypothetical protein